MTSQSTTSSKCSKTVVPTRESIQELLNKGMVAIDDNKMQSSSMKLAKLSLKLDHSCFAEERAFEREQCNLEYANTVIVHHHLQESVESQIRLKQAESEAFERQTRMFLAQAELMKLQLSMGGKSDV
ncbi:hypothetical protein PAXRUDRAFT_22300 [Paxillus rubicundulus Ve08.2h10]|uniref:Uncharacterized protein n=1 Tax=Paxillus rubicundulus Ve08.2h10 TaxID=930991 RepID=A0A0D0BKI7_9AGAM|nr:hypothetical protein PAXRUDRAFT_22300 [Paxillus rubicundulus Ve08.2h10]